MKRSVFTLLIALFMCSLGFAQTNVIDAELQEILNEKGSEKVSVNIIFKAQMETAELSAAAARHSDKEAKRAFVIDELKTYSTENQQDVMSILQAEKSANRVSDITAHWVVNMINCTASADVIYRLAEHPDVSLIVYNKKEKLIDDVKAENMGTASNTGNMTENITKVNADDVWDAGYTGEGVIVAVIDTGINYNHVDLANNMWDGGSAYPHHGYDFINGDNDPMDDEGHGTHCAGTICGDGTSGLKTGMAPGATLMCVKVLDGDGSGSLDVILDGVEFALDNGAHVLSLSLGFGYPSSYVSEIMRDTFVNVLNAGVVASVAAGNDRDDIHLYPIPNNVGSPGNCPPPWLHPDQQANAGGLSAVISVGAVDYNDAPAYFSSEGPVTFQETSYGDYPFLPINIDDGWLYYDNNVCVDGIGGPPSFYWGIKFPANIMSGYEGKYLTKVSMYDCAATSGGQILIYQGGENAPGTLVHTQEYSGTGSGSFVEYSLSSAIPIDETQSMWVVMSTVMGEEYPASVSNNTGNPNGRWISMDGSVWEDVIGYNLPYTWMIRAFLSDEAKGNISGLKPITIDYISSEGTFSAKENNIATNHQRSSTDFGLIRPDVSAPGVDIISCYYSGNNGHVSLSGTSMATPCNAGVIALMLDKNPDLTPADICRILETTAVPLSATKSNRTGSGRIDALAAINEVTSPNSPHLHFVSVNPETITTNEDTELNVTVANIGGVATIGNTNLTLSSSDTYVTVVSGEETVGVLDPEEEATSSFVVNVDPSTPDMHVIDFNLHTESEDNYLTNLTYGFENGFEGWTSIDADGDGNNWIHNQTNIAKHEGIGSVYSHSYISSALTPDNYLVSPFKIGVLDNTEFSFWACAQDPNYSAEHFGVAISTAGNSSGSDFTTIAEWTIGESKGQSNEQKPKTRGNSGLRGTAWTQYTVDLSEYEGQDIWIAIRHFNCTNQYILCVDDVTITNCMAPSYTWNDSFSITVSNPVETPEGLEGELLEDNTVSLSWTAVEYINGYHIYRNGSFYATSTENSFVDSNVYPEKAYCYTVCAVRGADVSEHSDYVCIETGEEFYVIPPVAVEANELDESSVEISWDWNEITSFTEDFETGDFNANEWNNTYDYPWTITEESYEGTYAMMSSNAGVNNSSSVIEIDVDVTYDGIMSFYHKISSEQYYDEGSFYIDEVVKLMVSGEHDWNYEEFPITAGNHTFRWVYTKDFSYNIGYDTYYVDNITFFQKPSPYEGEWIYYDDGVHQAVSTPKEIGTPETRSVPAFRHYNVYRSACDTEDPVLLASNVTETTYIDNTWDDAEEGFYKWGVSVINKDNIGGTEILYEGFEGGVMPEGWTIMSNNMSSLSNWTVSNGILEFVEFVPYEGTYAAFSQGFSYSGNQYHLITPAIDLTDRSSAELLFYYITPSWGGDINVLDVAVSTSAEGPWTTLWSSNGQGSSTWTPVSLDLSDYLESTIYVAFINNDFYGYCSGLDNVAVSADISITWSDDCIQKIQYYTETTVNVETDSDDEVTGAVVSFVNKTEPEMGYDYEVTLDEIGTFTWEKFRKGTYELTISLPGYISDYVNEEVVIEDVTVINSMLQKILPPANLAATAVNEYTVNLSWNAALGADSYNVYRGTELVGNVTETAFVDEDLTPFTAYCYTVTSVAGEVETEHSAEACVTTPDLPCITPTGLTAEALSHASVKLSWTAAPYAMSYNIYRDGELLENVTTTSYTDIEVEAETEYCYAISTVRNESESELTTQVCVTTPEVMFTAVTVNVETDSGDDATGAVVSFVNKTEPEMGYDYEVTLDETGTFTWDEFRIGTYELTIALAGYISDFVNEEVVVNDTMIINSMLQKILPPANLAATAVNEYTVNLSWNAALGADSYNVYRGTELVGNVTETAFVDEDLTPYTAYCYTVTSVAGEVETEHSAEACVTTPDLPCITPTGLTAEALSHTSVELSWTAAPNAMSYNIYRDGELIENITTTSYIDEGLEAETEYCYAISSVRNESESEATALVCVTTLEEPMTTMTVNVETDSGDDVTGAVVSFVNMTEPEMGFDYEVTLDETGTFTWDEFRIGTYELTITLAGYVSDYVDEEVVVEDETVINSILQKILPPANLAATAVNEYTVLLSWDAALGAEFYNVYRGTELIGYATETSFVDYGASPYTEYCYTVTSVAGEVETEHSAEACVTTPDLPCITPTELTAEALSHSSIELSWTAAPNAMSYNIYRDGELIENVTTTSYIDEELEAETEYCYAISSVRNESESEATALVCVTTLEEPMTSVTVNVETDSGDDATGAVVSFVNMTEPEMGFDYEVTLDETGTFTWEEFRIGTYELTISLPGYVSDYVDEEVVIEDVTVINSMLQRILPPANLTATAVDEYTVLLSWDAALGAEFYNVYRGTELIGYATETSFVDYGASPYTEYCYTVTSVAGEVETEHSAEACVTTPDLPCITPTGLTADALSHSSIELSWTAAPNAMSYNIYRDGELIENITTTSYTDEELLANTEYCYAVSSVRNDNESALSSTACATTEPLSVPMNLTATAVSDSKIYLNWDDNPDATSYNVYRDGELVVNVKTSVYMDHDLNFYREYCYTITTVRNNQESEHSEMVCATTTDYPSVPPTNLVAETIDEYSIALTWDEAAHAMSYNIYRDNEFIANTDDLDFIDDDLEPDTRYCYYVTSVRNNVESDHSNRACATTDEIILPCVPPTNLQAEVEQDLPDYEYMFKVTLTWDDMDNANRYTVYADGEEIGSTFSTSFVYGTDDEGTVVFTVTSQCAQGESDHSEPLEVLIQNDAIAEYENMFILYPNPADDKLIIDTEENIHEIVITNILGIMLYHESEYINREIDLSNFSSGTYFINIKTDKGEIIKRFIKK